MKLCRLGLVIVFASFFIPQLVFGQIKFNEFLDFELGKSINESKAIVFSRFKENPIIMKAGFYGAYQVIYEKTPFDFYGNCVYTFQFVKDTLVSLNLEYNFNAYDTSKARRLLKALLDDIKLNSSAVLINEYSNIKFPEIVKYITKECVSNQSKNSANYKPIKKKFLGQNFWNIYHNGVVSNNFFRVSVNLAERHDESITSVVTNVYDGCFIKIVLEVTTHKMQYLLHKLDELEIDNYRQIEHTEF